MSSCWSCGHRAETEFRFCPACGSLAQEGADPADTLVGRTLNAKYRILAEIGSGAMGTVYLGEHVGLQKRVALKVLHPDLQVGDEALKRFQREGIAAGKLNHPNAIQIFDFDKSEDGLLYLGMEFVEGSNLKVFLRRKGRLSVPTAVEIVRQVLSVLAEAHRLGIVHRDLKPDNVMVVTDAGGGLHVKVLDFGLSKLVDRNLEGSMRTQVGLLLGTPLYMAPEQCAGEEADPRSDLYAVGLVLYELLAGITPFPDESTTEILYTRTTREAPSLTASHPDLRLPSDLDRVLRRALQRRREDRFQSAAEMLAALDAVRWDLVTEPGAPPPAPRQPAPGAGSSSTAPPAPPGAPGTPGAAPAAGAAAGRAPSRRRRWLAVLALALLALLLSMPAWLPGLRASAGGAGPRASLKPAAERTPEETRYVGLLEEARSAVRARDAVRAFAAIEEALRSPDRDAEAYFVRASAYLLRDEPQPARMDLEEAVALEPGYVEALCALGWFHLERGDLDAGLARFRAAAEAARANGESAAALAGIGAVLRLRGETAEARTTLARAVELDPGSGPGQLHLGLLLLDEGRVEEASAALLLATRNDPRSAEAQAGLARALLRAGSPDEAERALRRALDLEPGRLEARIELGALLLGSQRLAESRAVLEEALVRAPDAGEPRLLLGAVLLELGEEEDARAQLERGFELGADDPRARGLLGTLHLAAGRLDEAAEAFDLALEQLVDPRLRLDRALVAFRQGRFEEAATHAQLALELDRDYAFAHYALGVLAMDYLDDPERAVEHLTRYRELGGRRPNVDAWLRRLER